MWDFWRDPCASIFIPHAGILYTIDEWLQKFVDWVKDYYADRPVLEV